MPVGKTLVTTMVTCRDGSPGTIGGGSTSNCRVIESVGPAQIGTVSVTAATAATNYVAAHITGTERTISAGNKLQVRPDVAYGSAQTCTADAFGYLF